MANVDISSPNELNSSTINSYSSNLVNPIRPNSVSSEASLTLNSSIIINSYGSNLVNPIRPNNIASSALASTDSSNINEGQLFPRGVPFYSLERFSTYSLNIGVKSYFKLNNNVNDSVVTRSFTLVNSPGYDTGKINNGLKFTATDQLCYITSAAFPVYEHDFSIALWFYNPTVPSTAGIYNIFSRDDFGLDYTTTGNTLRLYILQSDGVTFTILNPTFSFTPASWTLFIISYDSFYRRFRVRINNTPPQLFNYTSGFANTGATFYLNGQSSSFTWLNAVIDEVGFWDNRILSPTEEELLWNGGNGRTYIY